MEQQQKRTGTIMFVLMWLVIFALMGVFFSDVIEKQNNPNQQIDTLQLQNGTKELVLQRNKWGHYVADGTINGIPVTFMLDTGATDVSIPTKIANGLNLQQGPSAIYNTANGPVKVHLTRLNQIALGDIHLQGIRATINPGFDSDQILLGMSFLKHIEFSQRGNTLTLRQYPEDL